MTRYDAVTIAELIRMWADRLADEVEQLDATLPVEHETETRHQLKVPGIWITRTPETHPEMYEEYTVQLPLSELDNLRILATQMQDYCYRLGGKEDEP